MIGWQPAFYTAKILERIGKYSQAIKLYQTIEATSKNPDPKVNYSLGNCFFRVNDPRRAIDHIQLALSVNENIAPWQYRLGFIYENQKDWSAALEHYSRAVSLDASVASWHFRMARCFYALKSQTNGDKSLRKAIEIDPKSEKYYDLLAKSLNQQGKFWQELEALEAASSNAINTPDWSLRLANAYRSMNRHQEAATRYELVRNIVGSSPELAFAEGYEWNLAGNSQKANNCYEIAVAGLENAELRVLGPGYFFELHSHWAEAVEAYRYQLSDFPENAELHVRLAKSYGTLGDLDNAAVHYAKAVSIGPAKPSWLHELGKIYEKTGKFETASEAYDLASRLDGPQSGDVLYRLARSLEMSGNLDSAIGAYKAFATINRFDRTKAHAGTILLSNYSGHPAPAENLIEKLEEEARYSKDWELFYALAVDFEAVNNHAKARHYNHRAYMSSSGDNANLIYRYALSIENTGDLQGACLIYRQMATPQTVMLSDIKSHDYDTASARNAFYAEAYDTAELTDTILYESNHGSNASCNPLAIYEQAIGDPRLTGFDHVWVVNDPSKLPESITHNPDAHVVAKHSVQYRRQLASAKYLVSNSTFPAYFIRKPEQTYLNTWHGTPLKLMGNRVKKGDFEHRNVTRNLLQVSKLLAPNEHTLDCLINDHQIEGLFSGEIARIGTPRIDRTIHATNRSDSKIREILGIEPGNTRPVVLYAPTWRGGMHSREFDAEQLISDLTALSRLNIHLVFRAHHFAEAALAGIDINAIVAPAEIDTNDLLRITDVLVTDYSSIFFDYLVTRRPIVFYAYDLEEYEEHRGLYFPLTEMPGQTVHDIRALTGAIENLVGSPQQVETNYEGAVSEFAALEDGHAAQRALDFLLAAPTVSASGGNLAEESSPKKSLLFYQGSFMPNGITSAFLSLVNALDSDKFLVTVVIDPDAVFLNPENLDKYRQLPDHVRVVPRVGAQLRTVDENFAMKEFNQQSKLLSDAASESYTRTYSREFERIFGGSHFDVIVDFEGYSSHWASILGFSDRTPSRSVIYLHNDMHAEYMSRFPSLARLFHLYPRFDALVSVSKSVHEVNVANLAHEYEIRQDAFQWADNFVDVSRIENGGLAPLPVEYSELFDGTKTVFVTMGRLSPEKDHAKLIRSFAEVHAKSPKSRLVILGDGPLRQSLGAQITAAGLDGIVILAGLQENPFAIVKNADCFVFSSNYEGQGLALVEALVLGLPVISTNVVGPRSVLEYGHGLLVDNSVEGLVQGMNDFISGKSSWPKFSAAEYQNRASGQFLDALGLRSADLVVADKSTD